MKKIINMFMVALLVSGSVLAATAQQKTTGKLQVNTQLRETKGTIAQRQLYREFLEEYMKNCPFISNFKVQQAIGTTDDHNVVWTYNVNSWDDITKFYGWVTEQLKSDKKGGLKMAMTPYKPDYAIGGKIEVTERSRSLAKD